ncbi:MAG: hypothetical protein ABIV25_04585 [Paracoccaceae bacterium]
MNAPLTLSNAILPMAVLIALTIGLPALLIGPTLSQRRLALGMVATGLAVLAIGAGLMVWVYAQVNGGVAEVQGGVAAVWFFLGRSALMALLWGPVLVLVWLMRAQGVERRRGLLMREAAHEAVD